MESEGRESMFVKHLLLDLALCLALFICCLIDTCNVNFVLTNEETKALRSNDLLKVTRLVRGKAGI